MFSSKLPPSSNPFLFGSVQPNLTPDWSTSEELPSIHVGQQKREQFRVQIRNRQIQQYKKQIRFKQSLVADPNDYNLLKNINLTAVIDDCLKYGLNQKRVHCMFLYSSSKNMEHLNCMIDDKMYRLLIDNLIQRKEDEEIGWDRKIFWILTNYTSYTSQPNEDHLVSMRIIAEQIQLHSQQHLNLEQVQENIVLSVSNMFGTNKSVRYILHHHRPLLILLLNNFVKRKQSFSQICLKWAKTKKKNGLPRLLIYYAQLLNNLYSAIEYKQLDLEQQPQSQTLQPKLVKQMVKMMLGLLGGQDDGNKMVSEHINSKQQSHQKQDRQLFLGDEEKRVTYLLLDGLTVLFGHSLDNHPQLILAHKKQIIKLAVWFEKFMKSQQQSGTSDELIIKYLGFLQVIYGPNIPQDLQPKIYKFYCSHFENHVGIVCTSLFKSNNSLFHTHGLRLLQPILLEQQLSQLILNSYLVIISHVFQHLTSADSKYAHKKQSLTCLVNFIKSSLYQNSPCTESMLQILLANNIADIFAVNLWAYVDQELNKDIIEGVEQLLEAQKNQYGAKLQFWARFCQAGGTIKLKRIAQESNNPQLKQAALKVIDMQREQQISQ